MTKSTSVDAIQAIWLIAFGDLDNFNGGVVKRIPANTIRDSLLDRNLWYIAQIRRAMQQGDRVLLYQSEKGVCASAVIARFDDLTTIAGVQEDIFGLRGFFTSILVLDEVQRFEPPISLKPLVNRLSFISNKQFWGQSLRSTPRKISALDCETILESNNSA